MSKAKVLGAIGGALLTAEVIGCAGQQIRPDLTVYNAAFERGKAKMEARIDRMKKVLSRYDVVKTEFDAYSNAATSAVIAKTENALDQISTLATKRLGENLVVIGNHAVEAFNSDAKKITDENVGQIVAGMKESAIKEYNRAVTDIIDNSIGMNMMLRDAFDLHQSNSPPEEQHPVELNLNTNHPIAPQEIRAENNQTVDEGVNDEGLDIDVTYSQAITGGMGGPDQADSEDEIPSGFSIAPVDQKVREDAQRRIESYGKEKRIASVPRQRKVDVNRETFIIKREINNYQAPIIQAATKYNISPSLIATVIHFESLDPKTGKWNPKARSHKGAIGPMQVMCDTAKSLDYDGYCKDLFDPTINIEYGTKYLKSLLKRYNNNLRNALAAYNAGPENIKAGYKFADNVISVVRNIGNVITALGGDSNG